MSYLRMALLSALRQQLRRAGVYLMLLAALIAGLAFRWTAIHSENAPPVQVGVSLPEEDAALWAALEARENAAVRFILSDEAAIRAQVAASRWDCGLLFPEDFSKRLEDLDLDGSVTLLTGPGSAAYPLVRETAAAVLASLASPGIAEAYLQSSGIGSGASHGAVPRVDLVLETLDGRPLAQQSLTKASRVQTLLGAAAALLLGWTLFAAVDLGRWKETSAARRLRPCVGGITLLLPRLLAALLPAFCAAVLGLWTALGREAVPAIWMLLPYLAAMGALALLLAMTRRIWTLLPALLPYAAAGTLVLSPVLMDVAVFYPPLSPVCRYLPVTLYLSGCNGEAGAARTLLAAAAGLVVLALLQDRRGR